MPGARSRGAGVRVALPLCALLAGCGSAERAFSTSYGSAFRLSEAESQRKAAAGILGEALGTSATPSLEEIREAVRGERVIPLLAKLPIFRRRALAEAVGIPEARLDDPRLSERIAIRLRALFAERPGASRPARILFVEAGTGPWDRVAAAGNLASPPETWPGAVSAWENGSERAARIHSDFEAMRLEAARFQAGVLALLEYDWAVETVADYLLVRRQRVRSKVQATLVDAATGIVLDVSESYADETPPLPLFRNPAAETSAALERERRALAEKLAERLAGALRRELKPAP